MAEHGMGRNPSPYDARNWPVSRLRALIDEGIAVPMSWSDPVLLNQGQTNHCVGYAGAGFLATAQAAAPENPSVTNADGERIYYACKVRDTQPRQENGTSIWQLAHELKGEGIIDAYAFGGFSESKEWVQDHGPVVIGTNWYTGMDHSDTAGMIHRSGTVRGGHATLWRATDSIAVDTETLRNSWGTWGFRGSGDAGISATDLAQLIDNENGDAMCAVKFVQPPPPPPPEPVLPWPDFPLEYAADGFKVKESGLFLGYDDGLFRPSEPMASWQLATVFGRLCARQVVTRLDCLRMLAWFLSA